jgi:hypothetical protein
MHTCASECTPSKNWSKEDGSGKKAGLKGENGIRSYLVTGAI